MEDLLIAAIGSSRPLLNVKAVAARLQCSPRLVYHLCNSRKLPHIRLGSDKHPCIRIREEDLVAFMDQASIEQRQEKPG